MTQMIELVDRDSKIFSMWSGSYNKLLSRSMEELVNLNAYQQKLCKMKHKKKITGEQKKKIQHSGLCDNFKQSITHVVESL